jgi:transcriptional regulator with XRE-family HTH domain
MRLLREKYGVSLIEISIHCGISRQRLSEIELGIYSATENTVKLVESAFANVITARMNELAAFATDFQTHRNSLLDFTDEEESQ